MLRAILGFVILAAFAYMISVTGLGGPSDGGFYMNVARILMVVLLIAAVLGITAGLISGDRHKDVM